MSISESASPSGGLESREIPSPGTPSEPETSSEQSSELPPLEQIKKLLSPETEAADDAVPEDRGEGPGSDPSNPPTSIAESPSPSDTEAEPAELPDGLSVKELAEKAGTNAASIYKLQVPLSDGTRVPLGELKDAYQDRATTAQETAEAEERIVQRETALLRTQSELAQIMQELGPSVPPELRQRVAAKQQATAQRELALLLDAVPEWKDQANMDAFRLEAAEALQEYGFHPSEMVITDHRIMVFMKDHIALRKRMARLLEKKPVPKEKGAPIQSGPGGRAPKSRVPQAIQQARKTGREADKLVAVSELLQRSG